VAAAGVAPPHRSGRCTRGDGLLRVTAVGDDAVAAEVLAKSLFLAGEREAAESTVPAVLVTADGRTRFSRGLQQ
jgi:thiamine biosynthesis lipoprotein ApbE